jgi:hypothetical protein
VTPALTIQLLKRGVRILGLPELAKRLNTPPESLQLWMDGLATMPERKFLALVDILAADDK